MKTFTLKTKATGRISMLSNFITNKQSMKVLHRIGIVSLIIFAYAATSAEADEYAVVGVQNYLQVHRAPREGSDVPVRIPRTVSEITGYPASSAESADGQKWILIEWHGITGYVNKSYVEKIH
jgi:hypothetical protein